MPHYRTPQPEITDPKVIARFESRYYKTSSCWIWTGGQSKDGYGQMGIGRKVHGAHAISYRIFKGEIPAGVELLHKCDVRACVNPAHLKTGIHKKNIEQSIQNRRSAWLARHMRTYGLTKRQALHYQGLGQLSHGYRKRQMYLHSIGKPARLAHLENWPAIAA